MDEGARLRREFVERERRALFAAALRERRNRLTGAIGGSSATLVAAVATAAVTRRGFFWHSFLLEALLGALAGYLLAFQIRAAGFDPSVLFAPTDLRLGAASQGHLMSLGVLIACGGLIGHIMED